MVKRYPHNATIKNNTNNFKQDSRGNIIKVENKDIYLEGRFEPIHSSENLIYKAKFYSKKQDINPFELDGFKFIYENKSFTILQLFNYQTHCEIWLS